MAENPFSSVLDTVGDRWRKVLGPEPAATPDVTIPDFQSPTVNWSKWLPTDGATFGGPRPEVLPDLAKELGRWLPGDFTSQFFSGVSPSPSLRAEPTPFFRALSPAIPVGSPEQLNAKAKGTPATFPTSPSQGITALEKSIDKHAAGDADVALSMKMGVLLEGGNFDGNWGVGDQDLEGSYGPYQINYAVHKARISKEASLDPEQSTAYMLNDFRNGVARVRRERPDMFKTDPYGAAALAAYYAERPARMYPGDRQAWARAELERRRAAPSAGSSGLGAWDMLVPGGKGQVEYGGTHGGHPALDVFAVAGTPIYAPTDGYSTPATASLGGNTTTLKGADGKYHYFAHAQGTMVGGYVRKGQIIGYVGNTGNARNTPAHLHYAVASDPSVFSSRNGSGDIDPGEYYRNYRT